MDNIQKRLRYCKRQVLKAHRIGEERLDANDILFRGKGVYNKVTQDGREKIKKAFVVALEHRQKHGKAGIDFQRYYYYIAANGRLAYVPRAKAQRLLLSKKIVDHQAVEVIDCGTYVTKHRRLIDGIERNRRCLDYTVKKILYDGFEEERPCKMIIDTDFRKAYTPTYHDATSTDGDLANGESCMSNMGDSAQEFYGGIKGCKVVRFETDDGTQVGRCIMYEYNDIRHYIRIYGRGLYHRTMLNMLKDSLRPQDLFGRSFCIPNMRLKTDWCEDTPNMYLDGDRYGFEIDYNDNTWYVAVDAMYDGKNTDDASIGEVYEEGDAYECDGCGARIRDVNDDDVVRIGNRYYCCCDCAYEDGYDTCEWCGEWAHVSNMICPEDANGRYCCESCANKDDYYACEECGKYYQMEDMRTDENGEKVLCEKCLDESDEYTLGDDGYIVPKQLELEVDDE